jgi:hypothetical protein
MVPIFNHSRQAWDDNDLSEVVNFDAAIGNWVNLQAFIYCGSNSPAEPEVRGNQQHGPEGSFQWKYSPFHPSWMSEFTQCHFLRCHRWVVWPVSHYSHCRTTELRPHAVVQRLAKRKPIFLPGNNLTGGQTDWFDGCSSRAGSEPKRPYSSHQTSATDHCMSVRLRY